jgi:glycosyltransferase involved in cell wall biosynthesis
MALPFIRREFAETKFVVVGPDYNSYSKKLLQLAENIGVADALVITGRVQESELPMLYSCGDVFVMPSVYEGFGLSILEAMAAEVPVVASSSSGGPADFLTHKENAILLATVTPRRIHEAVSNLLSSSDLKKKICGNALSLVSSKFSWKNVVDKLELVYTRLADERR